jgi:hypothetical protein
MHHNRVGIAFFVFFGIIQTIVMANETSIVYFDEGLIRTMEADMAVAICLEPENKSTPRVCTLRYMVYMAMVKHAKDAISTHMIQRERFKDDRHQIHPDLVQARERRIRTAQIILTSTTMEAVLQLYFDLPPVYVAPITDAIQTAIAMYQPTNRMHEEPTPIAVPVKLLAERAKKWMQLLTSDDMLTAVDKVLAQHELVSTEMEAKGHE